LPVSISRDATVLASTLAIPRCILRSAIKLESVINLTLTVINLVQERPAWLSTTKAPTNCETEQSQQTLPPLNWIFPKQAPNLFYGRSKNVRNHPFPCPVTPLSFFFFFHFLATLHDTSRPFAEGSSDMPIEIQSQASWLNEAWAN